MDKLIVCFCAGGYRILCQDGTQMEFVDKTPTAGYRKMRDAVDACIDHGYSVEIV